MKLFDLEQRTGRPYNIGLYGLESYSAAYWRAAKSMIDNRLFDGHGKPDFSIFPIAFLYRHALELMLKAILVEHHEMYSQKPELLLNRGHKLVIMLMPPLAGGAPLPNEYMKELQSVVENAGVFTTGEPVTHISTADWSHVENALKDWDKHDPDGIAFRYGTNKKAKALKEPEVTFNIEHFAEAMEQALETLAELKCQLDNLRYQDVLRSEGL